MHLFQKKDIADEFLALSNSFLSKTNISSIENVHSGEYPFDIWALSCSFIFLNNLFKDENQALSTLKQSCEKLFIDKNDEFVKNLLCLNHLNYNNQVNDNLDFKEFIQEWLNKINLDSPFKSFEKDENTIHYSFYEFLRIKVIKSFKDKQPLNQETIRIINNYYDIYNRYYKKEDN